MARFLAWRSIRPILAFVGFAALCGATAFSVRAQISEPSSPEATRVDRVLLIGLDGAEWDMIDALVAKGRLPNIASLIAKGATGPLRSESPTRSPAIWATMATGKDRSVHRIYDFRTNTHLWPEELRDGDKRRLVTSNMRRVKAIWNLLEGPDRSVAVVGWLTTWPAEAVNGSMVTSYTAIGRSKQATMKGSLYRDVPNQTHPESLYEEILPFIIEQDDVTREQLKNIAALPPEGDPIYRVARAADSDLGERDIASLVKGLRWSYANNTSYAHVTRYLLESRKPNFATVYFEGIDSVGHRFWLFQKDVEYIEARMKAGEFDPAHAARLKALFGNVVENYYAYIDGLVGSLVEAAGPDTSVIIVSDHGFQDMDKAALRTPATFSGGHKLDGVIIMSGPGIAQGAKIEGAKVADITPTLLYLFGMPVGEDMTGSVIAGPLAPDFAENNPVRTITSYETVAPREREVPIEAPGIDATVVENLKALGYTLDTDEYTPGPDEPKQPAD